MLKEAFEFLTTLGRNTAYGSILGQDKTPEPGHIYYLRDKEGNLTKVTAEPKPRVDSCDSLSAIVQFAIEHKDAEIWYNRGRVMVTLDRKTRRESVTFKPFLSPTINSLKALEAGKGDFSQAQLIKFLRISLYGCLPPGSNLVNLLKKVKFSSASSSDQELSAGKVSIGRQLTQEVTATSTLPEDFSITVPVFGNACFANVKYSVMLALEPDASTSSFQLVPYAGQIEQAIANGEQWIGAQLKAMLTDAGAEVPLYYG